jgi:hypothetical protein
VFVAMMTMMRVMSLLSENVNEPPPSGRRDDGRGERRK